MEKQAYEQAMHSGHVKIQIVQCSCTGFLNDGYIHFTCHISMCVQCTAKEKKNIILNVKTCNKRESINQISQKKKRRKETDSQEQCNAI